MKIIRDNTIYVDKRNIAELHSYVSLIGMDVDIKIYGYTSSNNDTYEEYNGKNYIDFFSKIKYIEDYDFLNNMSDIKLHSYIDNIIEEVDKINSKKCLSKSDIIDLRTYNLRLNDIGRFMVYKKNNLIPSVLRKNNKSSYEEKKDIKALFKSYFKKLY